MLSALDLPSGTCGVVLALRGSAVDFVLDRLPVLVLNDGILTLARAQIPTVAVDFRFLSSEQVGNHGDIVYVGARDFYMVNKTGLFVHTDVRLIAKVSCVAFLGLACIWVALLLLVLGRRWRCDDRGINNGSLFEYQALYGEQIHYLSEQLFLQTVLDQ